ncbi:hypothetical protein [Streptomyces sp. 7N604]|uniref:hypothetical protein n=1 Tax=Streptomyces sp. 7N604 TaxID=3457415 RepID=UPI003FD35874
MKTELPGEIRKAFVHLEHRVTHLEDALAQACQLLRTTGLLDRDEHSEFQDSLANRREHFKQIMENLRMEEGEWSQLQDHDEHEDCDNADLPG